MAHEADCPFCKAFAVKPPSSDPEVGLLWQLPNDSPLHLYDRETKDGNTLGERLTIRLQDYMFVRITRDELKEIVNLEIRLDEAKRHCLGLARSIEEGASQDQFAAVQSLEAWLTKYFSN